MSLIVQEIFRTYTLLTMKNLSNLKGVKKLSKNEQKQINGGLSGCVGYDGKPMRCECGCNGGSHCIPCEMQQ